MNDHSFSRTASRRQRGIAVLVALIVLVAMSLAAVAMMRSVDTAAMIAGNLAFRQGASLGGDVGIENARAALLAIADLKADMPGAGYYASTPTAADIDLTGNRLTDKSKWVRWPHTDGTGDVPVCLAKDVTTGNEVCYIIHRLCDADGDLDKDTCHTYTTPPWGGDEGGRIAHTGGGQGRQVDGATQGYYRITVRTQGPRNNVSFLQAFVVI